MSDNRQRCGAQRMGDGDGNTRTTSGPGILELLGIGIGVAGLAALVGFGIAALVQPNADESPAFQYVQEPYRQVVSETFSNRNISQEECAICRELLCSMCGGVQQQIVQLTCAHIFHSGCIAQWLQVGDNPNCPTCRGTNVRGEVVTDKCKEKKTRQQ